VTAGELVTTEVKTLSSFPGSLFFNSAPWFLYISQFYINKFDDTRWKPFVGSMYTSAGTNSWGLWISPSPNNLIHWRVGGYDVNTTIAISDSDWKQLIVKFTGDSLQFVVRDHNTLVVKASFSTTNSLLWTSIVTTGVVTAGGWQNLATERFPGHIVGISFGRYASDNLISNVISTPIESGLTSNVSTSSIGFAQSSSRTSSLTSSNTNVASISGSADSYVITAKTPGTTSIQSIVLDTTGFFPPVNSSVTLTVSKASATLGASQSQVIVKYVLNSTVSFNYITTNNNESYTRTHTSGNTSVVTIPNSSVATAQIVGIGLSQISTSQTGTTNYLPVSGNTILIIVVGQGGTYSSINMTSLDLSGTTLSSTIFSNNCILTGANLYGVTVNASTDISTATLTNIKSGRIVGITTLLPSGYKLI
jgi:hypothetical protein